MESDMQSEMPGEKLIYRVPPGEAGLTVQNLLRGRLGLSRGLVRRLKAHGRIAINGKQARTCDRIATGDELVLILWAGRSAGVVPEPFGLEVVAEDDDFLVVNKSAGIVSHPVRDHVSGTLANAIAHHFQSQGIQAPVRLISRLDKDTSGLVLVAKNAYAHQRFNNQMQQGRIEKKYLAVVHGIVGADEGFIDAPICRDPDHPVKRIVAMQPEQVGKPAITHYRVLERWDKVSGGQPGEQPPGSDAFSATATSLELSLETGRTHQIRVHLCHIGHPLVGDSLYGVDERPPSIIGHSTDNPSGAPGPENQTIDAFIGRQALHASRLSFDHPREGTRLLFTSDPPEDMKTLVARLRKLQASDQNR
ncbi:MAG: RluA family pseudouridine synthase [Firmicutes bacterium]|nr:RluA family pseudouridine synthase [Bacillota bacterium]